MANLSSSFTNDGKLAELESSEEAVLGVGGKVEQDGDVGLYGVEGA